jgi:hypothetical protein
MEYKSNFRNASIDVLVFGSVVLLATVAACSREQPQAAVAVQQPALAPAPAMAAAPQGPPADPGVMVQDDYVYYPQYEVYYSSNRREYAYQEGGAWLWRASPPHVEVNVLFASPSVHMDFHDSPAFHHEVVMRSYPRNWAPVGRVREERMDHKDERDDRKEHH